MKYSFFRLTVVLIFCFISNGYTVFAVDMPAHIAQPTTENITSLPAKLFEQAFSQCQNGGLSFGYTFTGGTYQMQCASIAEVKSKLSIANYPAACPPNQIANGITGDKKLFICKKSVENTCELTPGQVQELNQLAYGSQYLTAEQWCNQETLILAGRLGTRTNLPNGIKKLTKLKTLKIGSNANLSVVDFIGNLTELTELDLSYSPSITSLPVSIKNLRNLKKFTLSGLPNNANECMTRTPITALPDEFTQLSALQDLRINCTGLTELPTNFHMLRSLSGTLSLTENQLSTLPEHLDELTNIKSINLSLNQITTLNGSNIENMTGLKVLALKGNRIENLPSNFNNLTSLEQLELHGNQLATLTGSNIEDLPNLQYLNLSYNPLTGLPENFGNLQNLRSFALESTNIRKLPTSFNRLNINQFLRCRWYYNTYDCDRNTSVGIQNYLSTGLGNLSLRNNLLETLPEYPESFSGFGYINLDGNRINSIPQSILSNDRLKTLTLTNNGLNSLPTNLEYFQGEELNLQNNSLTELPTSIGQINNLKKLYLQYNGLTSLPSEINQLSHLEELYLGDNQKPDNWMRLHNSISSLPADFGSGNLINLRILDLSYNPLISLPESIGNLGVSLKKLYLVGSTKTLINIPNSIANLTNLTELNLSPEYYYVNGSTPKLGSLSTRYYGHVSRSSVIKQNYVTITNDGVQIEEGGVSGNNGKIKIIVGLGACDLLRSDINELDTAFGSGMTDVQWCASTDLDFSNRSPKLTTIPLGIAKLKNLRNLNLSNNEIATIAASSFPNSLQKLDISQNLLTNALQSDCYGGIFSTGIKELNISNNRLNSLYMPCRNNFIESLNASHNRITTWSIPYNGVTNNPNGFRALLDLDISDNQITTWDMDSTRYPKIKKLNLSQNNINQFNKTINTNTGLTYFDISNNVNLRSLQQLYTSGSTASGAEDHIAQEDYSVTINSLGDGSPITITSAPNYTNECGLTASDVAELNTNLTGGGPGRRYMSAKSASEWCGLTEMDLSIPWGGYYYSTYSSLPNSLGKLKNLETLDLTDNTLTSLPESFTGLTKLKNLSLRNNNFTGTLSSVIGSLTRLERLYLDNKGAGFSIYNLKNEPISVNHLGKNRIEQLPDNFGALVNLRELRLEGNQLRELPPSFGAIGTYLTTFTINDNQIGSLPIDFGQSLYMPELNLSDNNLTELPVLFGSGGGFAQVITLKLTNNKLTSLPRDFGGMTNLQRLYLDTISNTQNRQNHLTELPDSFSNLRNLAQLYVSGNSLERLPEDFGNLTRLTSLDLNAQRLRSLPDSIGKLVNLSEFYLDNNQLTTFPNSFTGLTSMRYFSAVNNHDDDGRKTLTSVGDFFSSGSYYLRSIGLSDNAIQTLPDSIGGLEYSLANITLNNNKLTGLPDGFWRLHRLTNLNLANNNLQSLSGGITNLTNLQSLSLRENPAFTTLPENIGGLRNTLTSLDLYNGSIRTLPESISQLTRITSLDLRLNNLQSLPSEIGNLNKLPSLLVHGNELMSLPSSVSQMNLITDLDLTSNNLTSLPDEIANMTQLTKVNVSLNNGFNHLPENFGNLNNLSYLTLSDTALSQLPSSFDQLSNKLVELKMNNTSLGNLNRSFKNDVTSSASQENITSNGKKITITSQGNGTTLQIVKE